MKRIVLYLKHWWKSLKAAGSSNRLIAIATAVMAIASVCTFVDVHIGSADTHNLAVAAKLDQRAWVGLGVVALATPMVGDVAHASVTYVNTGRTPAKNVTPLTRLRFLPALVPDEVTLLELSKRGGSPAPILGAMYAGMTYPVPVDGDEKLKEGDPAALEQLYTYLWGEVAYADVFDEPHKMQFCAYRKGLTGTFLQCPFHNQPDYR